MATSGIWQTVWLESVPAAAITRLDTISNIDTGSVTVTVRGSNETASRIVVAIAYDGSEVKSSGIGLVDGPITIPVPSARLWQPSDPYLYNLTVLLFNSNITSDNAPSFADQGLFAAPDFQAADTTDEVRMQVLTLISLNQVNCRLISLLFHGKRCMSICTAYDV